MPVMVSIKVSSRFVATKVHTVPLDPQLALWYLVSPSIYICAVVRERNDVADFDLVFVIVEHEVAQTDLTLAYLLHQ
jgi:hypothetical protein